MTQNIPATSDVRKTAPRLPLFVIPMVLVAVSCAVYCNALFNDFVYDDMGQVLRNPWIRDVRYLPDMFLKNAWSFQGEHVPSNYYRPMMHLIYSMNYHLFGLKPWGFHLVNLLVHSGVCVLIFFFASHLFRQFTPRTWYPPPSHERSIAHGTLLPALAALLFAVHPIHTEAVAWIACIPDLSLAFFYLLSLYLYIITGEKDPPFRSVGIYASWASFLLACLCKETALTLPVMLLAYDLAFSPRQNWKRYIPYILIAAVYFLLRQHALHGFAPGRKHEELSAYQDVINVFPLFAQYLYKLVLPVDLNALYVLRPIGSILEIRGIVSLGISAGFLMLAAIAFKRKQLVVFFGLCLIMVPLLPVLSIPVLGENTFTERYLYLPSVGFVLLLGMCLYWLREKLPRFGLATVVAMLLIGLYSVQSARRTRVWADNITLFSDAVRTSPDNRLARELLGTTYLYAGRNDEALEQYEIALRIGPPSAAIYRNRGLLYRNKGSSREAAAEFQKALQAGPDDRDLHYMLGLTYAKLRMPDEAMEQYRLFMGPGNPGPDLCVKIGIDLGQNGLERDAVSLFEKALELDPKNVDAHYNLGNANAHAGKYAEAIMHFRMAVELQPNNPFFHNALGIAYGENRSYGAAVEQFQAAVRLSPDNPSYRRNLERTLELRRARGAQ